MQSINLYQCFEEIGLKHLFGQLWTYAGTWALRRRLQNPHLPTYEFVSKKTAGKTAKHIYVCGLGATGSLGLPKYYHPDKTDIRQLKSRRINANQFTKLAQFHTGCKINDIACGYGFTIVAAEVEGTSQTALGFGLNTHSQIGYQAARPGFPLEIVATPSPIWLPTEHKILEVACGRSHSLLKNEKGEVFSLGNNAFGQCGRPIVEKEDYFGSKKVHKLQDIPSDIEQICCGQDHSLFLTQTGDLYSCGWGADGQTGLGDFDNHWKPQQVKGDVRGVKIVKVASSADTVLALDSQGNLFGWGNTEYSQFRTLGNIEFEQFYVPRHLKITQVPGKIVDIAAGGTICAVLNDQGQVYVWGFGLLGKGPEVEQSSVPTLIPESLFGKNVYCPDTKIIKIYAGLSHCAAISNQGDLYTWGKNRGGALGFKHGGNQSFPMRVNMNLATSIKVALGVDHSCAIAETIC